MISFQISLSFSGVSLSVTAIEVTQQLEAMRHTLCQNLKLWKVIDKWTSNKQVWIDTPIELLKFDEIDHYIQKIQEIILSIETGNCIVSRIAKTVRGDMNALYTWLNLISDNNCKQDPLYKNTVAVMLSTGCNKIQ